MAWQGTLSIASVVGSILGQARLCGVRLCKVVKGKAWVKFASHAVHLRVSSREARCAIGLDWYGTVGFGEVMPA
jgi:hypothetical protein